MYLFPQSHPQNTTLTQRILVEQLKQAGKRDTQIVQKRGTEESELFTIIL